VIAAQLMSAPAVTVSAGATLWETARRMHQHGVKRLLAVDEEGRLTASSLTNATKGSTATLPSLSSKSESPSPDFARKNDPSSVGRRDLVAEAGSRRLDQCGHAFADRPDAHQRGRVRGEPGAPAACWSGYYQGIGGAAPG
jgi:CBS domain-containing protein